MTQKRKLPDQKTQDNLLEVLEDRFHQNLHRHKGVNWKDVQTRLLRDSDSLWSLYMMEETGGEPDVITYDEENDTYDFVDCSPESPEGRRSLCYDRKALEDRKKYKPDGDAMSRALDMGISILTEAEYRHLQSLESFDTKTSSWIKTPDDIRNLGGALFGDFRYGRVFTYHNGASSYYASRGFRGILTI